MTWSKWVGAVCVVAALFGYVAEAGAQASGGNPLPRLAGHWSGRGTITMDDGTRERIRCLADYSPEGENMRIGLRCASDSYQFELTSHVVYADGQISGNWDETTHSAAGTLSGTASPSLIRLRAAGPTFAALISISVHPTSQLVSIRSPGSKMSDVAITLSRK